MKNLSKKKLGVLAVLVAIVLSGLAIANPFKVTDPSDPRFDPDRFSFHDYKGRAAKIEVYKKLFPIGTPKKFVDRVLVEAGGATCGQNVTFPEVWYCRQPSKLFSISPGPPHFLLIFDDHQNLLNIDPYANGEIYPDSVTFDDLRIKYKKEKGIK